MSQRGDDNTLHDVAAHLRDRLEATAIIEDPNGAPFANIPCEGILWIDKHELFPGVMQLTRQVAIGRIQECVALRRDDVERVLGSERC
jgi:hypothetical protein